jgi:hypothetical protein
MSSPVSQHAKAAYTSNRFVHSVTGKKHIHGRLADEQDGYAELDTRRSPCLQTQSQRIKRMDFIHPS